MLLVYSLPFLIALLAASELKIPKPMLIGAVVALAAVLGVLVMWLLRDSRADAMGDVCSGTRTPAFIEFWNLTFFILAGALSAASGFVSAGALRMRRMVGGVVSVLLLFGSPGTAFFLNVAMGLMVVDGFRCWA